MVDVDSQELVYSWLLKVTASAPVVTRTYDIALLLDRDVSKKIEFINPYDVAREFRCFTSNKAVCVPSPRMYANGTLSLGPRQQGFLDLRFLRCTRPGDSEIFVFVVDRDGNQSEETILLRLHYEHPR